SPVDGAEGARLIRAVIEARGGATYLGFKAMVATGQYTPFDGGRSTVPAPFLDTIVFPDKERTEFGRGKRKNRRIQVNVGSTGWVYDGDAETLKDQNEKQTREFLEGLENDLDHILKGGWQAPGVRVRLAGREEIRPGERADVIEIELTPARKVSLWLDRSTHLPLSLVYERTTEQGLTRNEVRFFQYIVYEGVKFPNIVDFYRDGVQINRINYQDIKLNVQVPDDVFAKPANVKAVK
ncbi:MAG: hypothetical protein ABI882_10495, partial [Acidobacteriota bacterium]